MTPLRSRMTEDMKVRNLPPNTQQSGIDQMGTCGPQHWTWQGVGA